jgi:hypothetical protein
MPPLLIVLATLLALTQLALREEDDEPAPIITTTTGLSVQDEHTVDYAALFTTVDPYKQLNFEDHGGLVFIGEGSEGAFSQEAVAAVKDVLQNGDISDYSAGFVMYDFTTGMGLAYNSDELFYSASSIKGPYVASLVAARPASLEEDYNLILPILEYSSNDAYVAIVEKYGVSYLCNYFDEAGATVDQSNPMYPFLSTRDLARLWVRNWEVFRSDMPEAEELSELFTEPNRSPIDEQLGYIYTTYSKAGWYDGIDYESVTVTPSEGGDEDGDGEAPGETPVAQPVVRVMSLQSAVVGGIVVAGDRPYLIAIMSNSPGALAYLDPLVLALDMAHDDISSLTEEEIVRLQRGA